MKYMLMMISPVEELSPENIGEDLEAEWVKHNSFAALVKQRGGEFSGEALEGPETARTLRRELGGGIVVADGPFVEAKEGIGGYYIVEAESMEDAIELARHCPLYAAIEIRPVWEVPGGAS